MKAISQLFDREPAQWGLRGDPYLWKEMKAKLGLLTMPEASADLERVLHSAFLDLTERTLETLDPIFVQRYDQGGMSSGMVCPEFWRNTAIPLIVSRYDDAKETQHSRVEESTVSSEQIAKTTGMPKLNFGPVDCNPIMPTIKQLLTACGLETPHDQIKLVRHSDHLGRSIRQIVADGAFDIYQAEQHRKICPFGNCEVILSFIGIEGNQAEFH